jgi:hypothetical protein
MKAKHPLISYLQYIVLLWLSFAVCVPMVAAQPHWQKADYLIESFIDIALKREYREGAKTNLHRWREPLKIFIRSEEGDPLLQQQMYYIQAKHLQHITGHPLYIVNSQQQANVLVVFTSLQKMKSKALQYIKTTSDLSQVLKSAVCMASIESNKQSEIIRGVILIPVDSTRQSGHLVGCVVEELTQVMGLPNDSSLVYPSIFNDRSIDSYLTGLDYLLLKIAYHPLLEAGMSEAQVREKLPDVLIELREQEEIENAQKRVLESSLQSWLGQ